MSINSITSNPVILDELATALTPDLTPTLNNVVYTDIKNLASGSINQILPFQGVSSIPVKANKPFLLTSSILLPSGATGGTTGITINVSLDGVNLQPQTQNIVVNNASYNTISLLLNSTTDNPSIYFQWFSNGGYFNTGVPDCKCYVQIIQ